MFRTLAVVAALLVVTSPRLFALGLGEIDMQSALNQPMKAVIELTSSASIPLETLKVSLASLEAHQRAGLTKAPLLANFKFTVEKGGSGNAVIRVSSSDAVHEPYLEFLLELEWPNGRLLRQYTVLVDPPVTMPATPVAPPAPVTRAATRPATPTPVREVTAPAVRPSPAPGSATAAQPKADEYGPIRRDETLWSIAERVRPGEDISMHQMMLALQRANPDAFMNGNMNLMKAGSTLKIPGREEILSVSAREALAEVRRQHNEWVAGMNVAAENAAVTPVPGPYTETDTGAAAVTTGGSKGARLQLVAPEGDAVEGAASPGDPETVSTAGGNLADLTQRLALATEEAEASKAESAELQSRVTELEAQIETMKRLLELKDDALAGMQNDFAAKTGDADTEAVTEAAPEPVAAVAVDEPAEPESLDTQPAATRVPAAEEPEGVVAAVMHKVMDNPILAGTGTLALLMLGGFLWLANRRNAEPDAFDEEMTLANQLTSASTQTQRNWRQPVFDIDEDVPVAEEVESVTHETTESDPVTEAEVYLAYGRIQQAEDVLRTALLREPDNDALRLKLLEVHHIAGNTAAFEQAASEFRDGVAEDDARWIKVATMGYAMAPHNRLYRAGVPADIGGAADTGPAAGSQGDNTIEFDMDLSGAESPVAATTDDEFGLDLVEPSRQVAEPPFAAGIDYGLGLDDTTRQLTEEQPSSMEFGLDELEEEDGYDGTLASEDEVTTKLDLARAYIDMDDRDSARSILGEVMEEGNAAQKQEAEKIFAQIA